MYPALKNQKAPLLFVNNYLFLNITVPKADIQG